jgi:hypothetical protein
VFEDGSALALLVAGVGTDDAYDAFAANNFAIFAKFFNRCANFHIQFFFPTTDAV